MEISRYSSKFILMQDVARKILIKCSGCMLATSILGSVLSSTSKNESAWKKVYAQFKHYASAKQYTPHDYNGTIFAAIDLSLDHDENNKFSKDLMWSVLQALSLFISSAVILPSSVVKLAWKSMQPEGETKYFEALVNSLIHKNLVDGFADRHLRLHHLVGEYVEWEKPIDLVTILCDQEGELKQGRELLAIFLSIYGKPNDKVPFRLLLSRAGAVFHHKYKRFWLHELLDSDAENAILAVFELYKATQQDAKALLHLILADDYQRVVAAEVLVLLMINVGAENLLVDGDIQNFVQLCTRMLRNISKTNWNSRGWLNVMLKMASCSVFAKKMICHRPLLILIVEGIQNVDDYLLEYVEILVALILYVRGIRNARLEENVLEEDEDVMRESIKSCVLDNTFMSDNVLYYGENSSKGTKVPLLEPKLLFELLHPLLQKLEMSVTKLQMSVTSKDIREFVILNNWTGTMFRVLKCLVNIPNGATHFVEYGYAELLYYLEDPEFMFYLEDAMGM
jgi:hypothetical protein